MKTAKVILGITVAAAAGAAIGLLLAPEKGKDLQKRLRTGAGDWLNDFSTLLKTGRELVSKVHTNLQRTQEAEPETTEKGIDY